MTTHKPPALSKLTAAGKLKGRPRNARRRPSNIDEDGIQDTPAPRRETRPGPTTRELIGRVVAAGSARRLHDDAHRSRKDFVFVVAEHLFRTKPTPAEVAKVDRWLRDPVAAKIPGVPVSHADSNEKATSKSVGDSFHLLPRNITAQSKV